MFRLHRSTLLLLLGLAVIGPVQANGQEDRWKLPEVEAGEFAIDPPAGDAGVDASRLKAQAQEILSRPEFRRVHAKKPVGSFDGPDLPEPPKLPQWLRDILEWLGNVFSPLFSFLGRLLGGLMTGAPVIFYMLIVACVAAMIYVVCRVIMNFFWRSRITRKTLEKIVSEGEAELGPGETPADVYLQRAKEFSAAGRFREAIAMLLLGGMSNAERAGWIRHRRGLTHRDYLRAMRSREQPYTGFKTIVSIFEPICFGRRDAYREHYEASLESYQKGFGSGAAT